MNFETDLGGDGDTNTPLTHHHIKITNNITIKSKSLDSSEPTPEVPTCRICRGEATFDNPLYHPCKCKGSIKYLHEPCLLEWISARNLDISKPGTSVDCDICHYPFQFSTTYAEDMPEKIPFTLLVLNSFFAVVGTLHHAFTIVLLVSLIIIGIPLSWNVFGKLYTFLLDGKYPYPGKLFKSLIFGFQKDVPDNYSWEDAAYALIFNQEFSLWQIIIIFILHLALYFQYDMIVREDVFSKMVFHKIGPNISADALKTRLKDRFPAMDDDMLQHVARVMAEREVRENREVDDVESDPDFVPDETINSDSENSSASIEEDDDDDDEIDHHNTDFNEHNFHLENPIEDIANHHAQRRFDNLLDQQRAQNVNGLDIPLFNVPADPNIENNIPPPRVIPVQLPAVEPFEVPEVPVADNEQQQVGPLLINIQLKLVNILLYFGIGLLFSSAYLGVSYFVPTIVGYGLLRFYFSVFKVSFKTSSSLFYLAKADRLYNFLLTPIPQLEPLSFWINNNILSVIKSYTSAYFENTMKSSTMIRGLPSLTTYMTAICIVCATSELISKGYSRKNGMPNRTRRYIFQVLFAIKCTFKVFTLFFIELAGFPILAGAMLDFSLFAPLLGGTSKIMYIPSISFIWHQNEILYWMIGTLYMYWFAKYIGMIRQYIIRPGVLFFIRSPDDPNTRILHDSLIHPMNIQLSRLCLSMFIYAVFIILGFGFHTRVLFPIILSSKILNSPDFFINGLIFNLLTTVMIFYFTKRIVEANPNVRVIVKDYWMKIFKVSSKKLRLSSFILGTDYASERGHILYRSLYYKLFVTKKADWSNPDLFTSPKTFDQAQELFKEDKSVHAYFIPDGVLMRVPSSDIVSRNYVQTMFVPVTKSDKLLKPLDLERVKERNRKNAGEFGYLDLQNTDFDEYFICYVPPNFRLRYICLMVLMWLFASVLIICTSIISQYLFNTVTAVAALPALRIFQFSAQYEKMQSIVQTSYKQLNVPYVCLGAILLSFVLDYYKSHDLSRHFVNENGDEDENEGNNVNNNDEEPNVNNNGAQPQPVNAAARPNILDIIFENWIAKYLISPILVFILSISRYAVFGIYMGKLIQVCVSYFRFIIFGDTSNVYEILSDTKSYFFLFINACFMLESLITLFKYAVNISRNNDRRVLEVLKIQWNTILKPDLKFIAYCYGVVIADVVICSTLEYLTYGRHYGSFLATLNFMTTKRLSSEYSSIKWTLPQHFLFVTLSFIIMGYIVSRLYKITQKWLVTSVQNVKDEVYAKGRSLENYGNAVNE